MAVKIIKQNDWLTDSELIQHKEQFEINRIVVHTQNTLNAHGHHYHFVVDRNGSICNTASTSMVVWHAGWLNKGSLSVCMLPPHTAKQLKATVRLCNAICLRCGLQAEDIYAHRDLMFSYFGKDHGGERKQCGAPIDMKNFRAKTMKRMQQTLTILGSMGKGKWHEEDSKK